MHKYWTNGDFHKFGPDHSFYLLKKLVEVFHLDYACQLEEVMLNRLYRLLDISDGELKISTRFSEFSLELFADIHRDEPLLQTSYDQLVKLNKEMDTLTDQMHGEEYTDEICQICEERHRCYEYRSYEQLCPTCRPPMTAVYEKFDKLLHPILVNICLLNDSKNC